MVPSNATMEIVVKKGIFFSVILILNKKKVNFYRTSKDVRILLQIFIPQIRMGLFESEIKNMHGLINNGDGFFESKI